MRINPFTLPSLSRPPSGEAAVIVGSSCSPSHLDTSQPFVSAGGNGNDGFGQTSLLVIALAFPSGTKIRSCSLLTYFRDRICYLCLSFFVPPSPFHLSIIACFLFLRPIFLSIAMFPTFSLESFFQSCCRIFYVPRDFDFPHLGASRCDSIN